jgi:hypothetical protein
MAGSYIFEVTISETTDGTTDLVVDMSVDGDAPEDVLVESNLDSDLVSISEMVRKAIYDGVAGTM